MALTRVHHVGQIVGDLQDAIKVYVDGFGLAVDSHRTPLPLGGVGHLDDVSSLQFPVAEMYLEASAPRDPQSAAGRYLAERNGVGGMHHVAFASTDLMTDVSALRSKGLRFLDGPAKGGSVFIDPETTLGLLIELAPSDDYFPHPIYRGDGTVTGMAHIGVAARSEKEIRDLFTGVFGFRPEERMGGSGGTRREDRAPREEADDDVSIVEYPFGGTVIEISIPNDDVSGTARFVAQRGQLGAAWHHICPFTPDVHTFMDRGRAAGLRQLGTIPPRGDPAMAVGWFHPRSALGTLVEVWNRPPNTP